MSGIRRWLTTTALLTGSAAWAQPALPPVPADEPPIATALPGGTVVSGRPAPTAVPTPGPLLPIADPPPPVPTVPAMPAGPATPAAAAPIVPAQPANGKPVGPVVTGEVPIITPVVTNATYGGCAAPGGDCCGPIGAHGPIGSDIYLRSGASFPIGNGLLAHGLNTGVATTGGGRALFFDPPGTSAWAVDVHAFYTYNNSSSPDVATLRGEPVTVRTLHRSGVGLGIGRDHFLAGPGFVGGLFDANLRWGWDAGARWGAGHVDLNTVFEPGFYRRHYDVFGQPFVGLNADLNVPMGGWTGFVGGRLEWNYTFSDILPKQGSFQEVLLQFSVGVRY